MFDGELILKFLDKPVNGKWFITVGPLYYKIFNEDRLVVKVYTVPSGVHTDFASIPRGPLRTIIPRVGLHGKAAVFHDYLCESGIVSRKLADKLFLMALKSCGVGFVKRRIMYAAVRAYSISTFKK